MKKSKVILSELKEHFPFTFTFSFIAGLFVFLFYFNNLVPSESLFEILHPLHVFASAIATSAIYWKYKKSVFRSILIGANGAILIGSLSDVLFPFLAGNLFSLHTYFHLPIFEEPFLILGVALLGGVLGMYSKLFNVGHSVHIFLSIFASLFYLLAFSIPLGFSSILLVCGLVFLTVYIPCCISDIIFPLLFLDEPCSKCGHWH